MIAKEGEFASLLALVSEDMVDMQIDADAALDILDTKGFRRARIVDDDCIELGVNLKLNEKGTQIAEGAQASTIPVWPSHTVIASGITETGEQRRAGKKREKVLLASALITAVENAGKDGVSISGLKVSWMLICPCRWLISFAPKEYFNEPESVIITAVEKALDHRKLVLTGYSKPVLVHPAFKAEWELSEECPRPKQWLDIHGGVVDIALYRCRRAVYGLLVQKPGINQVRILPCLVAASPNVLHVIARPPRTLFLAVQQTRAQRSPPATDTRRPSHSNRAFWTRRQRKVFRLARCQVRAFDQLHA